MNGSASGCAAPAAPASGQSKSMADGTGAAADTMKKGDCAIKPVPEAQTDEAICRLYYKLKHQSLPILEQMLETLRTIRDRRLLWSEDIVSLNKKKYPNSPVRIKRWPFSSKTASLILTFLYPKATS